MTPEIKKAINDVEKAKKNVLKVVKNSSLKSQEKLEIISSLKLFETDHYRTRIFEGLYDRFKEQVAESGSDINKDMERYGRINECWNDYVERRETMHLSDILENIGESYCNEDDIESDDFNAVILTGFGDHEFSLPYTEICDYFLELALKEEFTEFTYDW